MADFDWSRMMETPDDKTKATYVKGKIQVEQQQSAAEYATAYKKSQLEGWPQGTPDEVKKLEFAIWKSGIISA